MIDYKNSKLVVETSKLQEGVIRWRSPSNIAIVKYWGKHGIQLPRNPSISFTLDKAYTETSLEYQPKTGVDEGISLRFYFQEEPNSVFEERIKKYLNALHEIFPFLRQLHLTIRSTNSFPHSAGIASSASAMSALALCLCTLEDQLFDTLKDDSEFRRKASFIARLGSGSACRSIYATAALWGGTKEVEGSSDLFATSLKEILNKVFHDYCDDILILDKKEKAVSSSAGHQLMEGNIFADSRYSQARQRIHELLRVLKSGDLEIFGNILEKEALSLHGMMMVSNPPYLLLKPNTISAIQQIWAFRKATGLPLYFSLDAGPNLHLLYPQRDREQVHDFIKSELVKYCENGQWLEDQVGLGPLEL